MPDARTVVFKMAFPVANMLSSFAFQRYLWMMPVEADGKYDPKTEMRGSGAWRLTSGSRAELTLRAQPRLAPDAAFFQNMYKPIVSEYAQRRAQLVSGRSRPTADSIDRINAEDIVATKKEQPKLNLYADSFPDARPAMFGFGFLPNSPFHDVRVRRAASMVLDRETLIDAFYNVAPSRRKACRSSRAGTRTTRPASRRTGSTPRARSWVKARSTSSTTSPRPQKLIRAAGITSALKMPGFFSTGNPQRPTADPGRPGDAQQGKLFDIALQGFPTNE